MLQFLLGDIETAHGIAVNQKGLYQAQDAVSACWKFSSGVLGSGSWNFGANQRADEMQIIGSTGKISFSIFDEAPVKIQMAGDEQSMFVENPAHIQLNHVENMIRQLKTGIPHPSLGVEAAKTNLVLSRILELSR